MREYGWESLLTSVISICDKRAIRVHNMDEEYAHLGRKKRELNHRFDEVSMDLLLCISCLNLVNSFPPFDKLKLLRLAEYYPNELSSFDLLYLEDELDNLIHDMQRDERIEGLKYIGELCKKLIETTKYDTYRYRFIYLLIKMVLILPMATATLEWEFYAMTIVKIKLSNSMRD
ncbi:uncharacterized protein [Spinacia oleracea]|uniref:Uncharacterized protein n=1 Tax=Spinacia oleracea TaxID=3562 RepID=A0A9R0IBF5_SPIOL|nr:uncharacterized protein LOC110785972 [Spinacia oleracea]